MELIWATYCNSGYIYTPPHPLVNYWESKTTKTERNYIQVYVMKLRWAMVQTGKLIFFAWEWWAEKVKNTPELNPRFWPQDKLSVCYCGTCHPICWRIIKWNGINVQKMMSQGVISKFRPQRQSWFLVWMCIWNESIHFSFLIHPQPLMQWALTITVLHRITGWTLEGSQHGFKGWTHCLVLVLCFANINACKYQSYA